jgi:hypothetical protein
MSDLAVIHRYASLLATAIELVQQVPLTSPAIITPGFSFPPAVQGSTVSVLVFAPPAAAAAAGAAPTSASSTANPATPRHDRLPVRIFRRHPRPGA